MTEKKVRMPTAENPRQGHTIVGGRPQAVKERRTDIPRGLELVVKKAAVDTGFREELLLKREKLIDELGIPLDPSEKTMLACVPLDHLEKMIAATTVPPAQRKTLAGASAAAMIAILTGLTFVPVAGRAEMPARQNVETSEAFSPPVAPRPSAAPPKGEHLLTGIRPDDPENLEPVPLIKKEAEYVDYEDHLADRGARPDFPGEEPLLPVKKPIPGRPEIVSPFAAPIQNELQGKTLEEALQEIANQAGINIETEGISLLEEKKINTEVVGQSIADGLESICKELCGDDVEFNLMFDSENTFIKLELLETVLPSLPTDKPVKDDAAICRGIRSDMPGLKKSPVDPGDLK